MAKIYGNTTATPIPLTVVDQNYSSESTNAQSGKAVALAIKSKADKETLQGGFTGGKSASVSTGGAVGKNAEAWKGGAVGEKAISDEGGAVGENAKTDNGGAVGSHAESTSGGAVGKDAYSERGGAIGERSESKGGGAVGILAKAGNGFSGGMSASVEFDDDGDYIDAIQLGSGKNKTPKTLQVYNYTLMNNDGTIPEERLTKAKAYTNEKASELSSSITTLENNAIECTSSGAVINIKDSAEVKPRGLKLYGKTEQFTTTGKNLWDKDNLTIEPSSNGYNYYAIEVGVGNTVTVSYSQTLKIGLDMYAYVNTKKASPDSSMWLYHDTNSVLINKKVTLTADNGVVYVGVNTGSITSGNFMSYIGNDLQIEIGPDATPYEPYTGGIASPNPEYPQELISIGDSGSVDVELYCKNLWDKDTAVSRFEAAPERPSYSVIPIRVGVGNTVTVSYNQTLETGLGCSTLVTNTRKSAVVEKWLYNTSISSLIQNRVTLTATEEFIYLYTVTWYISGTPRFMQYIGNDLQIEISPSATECEEYKKQSISISTPNGLHGIPVTSGGNYTDENGQQYICDEIDAENKVHIHRLEKIDSYNGEEITTQYMSTTGELSIGATVIYALETPYETPFTDGEIEAYKALTMYKPVTNIFNSDNAHMEVDYVADTKTYIDNKFTVLQNAIISTGGNV